MTQMKAFLAASLLASAGLAACVADGGDDPSTTAAALEQANGGLTTDDEAPMFDDTATFDAAQIEGGTAVSDPYAADLDASSVATTALMNLAIVWGQLPPDRDAEHAVDWSGSLALNRGTIVVRRTIGFEDATDALAPRTDRLSVSFTSITRPFADGLALTVLDPDPASADPLTLTYTRTDGTTHQLALAELLAGPVVRTVDDQGDKVVAIAIHRGDCEHGFGRGRWRALRDDLGGFLGMISNGDGDPIGHIRGIWGARRNGEQVFFGKVIDLDGHFLGIFAGHYAAGEMRGHWLDRSGEVGRLQGRYDASAPGHDGGHFLLRWADAACAADIPTDGN
jgi:hypothetical protein